MSESKTCLRCQKPDPAYECGVCAGPVCKDCMEYLEPGAFSFMSKIPPVLKKNNYCLNCFDTTIVPAREAYNAMMEKAEDIYFITKNYPGYVRVMRKHTKRVNVPECADRRETILRLAFFAAELGFNAIIDAEVESTKVRKNAYQSHIWHGSAMPAIIDGAQLERSSLRRI